MEVTESLDGGFDRHVTLGGVGDLTLQVLQGDTGHQARLHALATRHRALGTDNSRVTCWWTCTMAAVAY